MVGGFNFKGFYCLASASLTISNLSLFLKNPKTATPKPTRTSIALTTESKFSVSKSTKGIHAFKPVSTNKVPIAVNPCLIRLLISAVPILNIFLQFIVINIYKYIKNKKRGFYPPPSHFHHHSSHTIPF